jgi:hypothetical protein
VPHAETARAPGDLTVALSGGANALWWDAAASVLYLTDSNTSSLLAWTDAEGIREVCSLPADAAGPRCRAGRAQPAGAHDGALAARPT